MKSNYNKQHGFTLVEMAIIVVLAGILLAAGVMAGRGMISRAQTQDVLKIIGDLQGAALAFKQRYGYLPGDWLYVANQLPNVVASVGNGDGLITGALPAAGAGLAPAGTEIESAPKHLYEAGLIGKIGSNTRMRIQSQFGGVHMAEASTTNTNPTYPAANPSVKNVIVFYNLPCEVILEVDRALDDGNDTTGRARGSVACLPATGSTPLYFVPL